MAPQILTKGNSGTILADKSKFHAILFDAEFTDSGEVVKDVVTVLERLMKDHRDQVNIASVDAEKETELVKEYSVVSVPVVLCISNNGKSIKKIDTFEPERLALLLDEELKKHLNLSIDSCSTVDPKQKFLEYLKNLTNRAPVMVFMKGQPSMPRCGFSKQLVALLAKHDVKYDSFDILEDDDVRQGLKEYSEWPTYPQIYVKGEFIGGLDILKEMDENGELASALKP